MSSTGRSSCTAGPASATTPSSRASTPAPGPSGSWTGPTRCTSARWPARSSTGSAPTRADRWVGIDRRTSTGGALQVSPRRDERTAGRRARGCRTVGGSGGERRPERAAGELVHQLGAVEPDLAERVAVPVGVDLVGQPVLDPVGGVVVALGAQHPHQLLLVEPHRGFSVLRGWV